jgi:hypothetical protein
MFQLQCYVLCNMCYKYYFVKYYLPMLGGSLCHHSMARPQVADERDGLQLEVSCEYIE